MLAKPLRLPATIRLVSPKSVYSPYFTLKIAKNGLEISRFGFIVGKKIDKRAVIRNRLRRRFRAGIEAKLDQIKPGYDLLFLLKKEALEQSTEALWKEAENVLKKNRLMGN